MPKGVPYFFRENFCLCATVRHSEYPILHTHSNGPSHWGEIYHLKKHKPLGENLKRTQKIRDLESLGNFYTTYVSTLVMGP